jgi:hypothetical protein
MRRSRRTPAPRRILGSNLGDRRDAVQLSELGEGQFYRLLARRIDATLTWQYK